MALLKCIVRHDAYHKINLYTKRNELLCKYPMFASLIKTFCHQHDLYGPNINFKTPSSLKLLCARSSIILKRPRQ